MYIALLNYSTVSLLCSCVLIVCACPYTHLLKCLLFPFPVSITLRKLYGYLDAADYPAMVFYTVLLVMYLFLAVVWGNLCCCYYKDLIRLQVCKHVWEMWGCACVHFGIRFYICVYVCTCAFTCTKYSCIKATCMLLTIVTQSCL